MQKMPKSVLALTLAKIEADPDGGFVRDQIDARLEDLRLMALEALLIESQAIAARMTAPRVWRCWGKGGMVWFGAFPNSENYYLYLLMINK